MNRVLVVDDDCGMRSALEARFLRRGWQVETAANATDAVAKFRRGLHPLIVTDIRMPGEDGLFVMRTARDLAPHTAVILLTAFASVPDAVDAMKDGACDYIPSAPEDTPYFRCQRSEMKDLLARVIAELPEKEQQVLSLYYFEELTMKEVGAVLGIGESRVSQIHSLAVVRLRSRLEEIMSAGSTKPRATSTAAGA
jgi:RNA polymerase sigma factor (sigma-70 family)